MDEIYASVLQAGAALNNGTWVPGTGYWVRAGNGME